MLRVAMLSCLALFQTIASHGAVWDPGKGLTQIPVWPGVIPDASETRGIEQAADTGIWRVARRSWTQVDPVTLPTYTVYPPKVKSNGAALIVFPGGGYQILAIDLEGSEVCDWITEKGFTCIVLKYRVPGEGKLPASGAYPNSKVALEDAQRTIGVVRYHAAELKIDPHKIGVIGFSAGGHLVAATSTLYKKRVYPLIDDADHESCRPDFAIALYPGHLLEHTENPWQLNPFVPVTTETPPTLLIQSETDPVDAIENALVYFEALKRAKVAAELHIYAGGGHAFGLRKTEFPITQWTELAEKWLKTIHVN